MSGTTDRAASSWEDRSAEQLAGAWGVPRLHLYESVGSTNDVARRLAEEGAPAGTVVLAEEQLRGRGRAGRAWASAPGLGIWMSVVLRPSAAAAPGLVPLAVGLAAAEALDAFAGPDRPMLKWPNDLQIGGRKLAGILCEGVWEQGRPAWIVAGIGVNVLHGPGDLPPELREDATSLRLASGGEPDRAAVAGAVLRGLRGLAAGIDPNRLAAGLEPRDALRGREVRVLDPESGAPLREGIALGIAPDGALLVRTRDGVIRHLRSGTVRPAPAREPAG